MRCQVVNLIKTKEMAVVVAFENRKEELDSSERIFCPRVPRVHFVVAALHLFSVQYEGSF